ncbi:hypothetical protein ACH4TS_10575 [Streptomyces albidoflavus]
MPLVRPHGGPTCAGLGQWRRRFPAPLRAGGWEPRTFSKCGTETTVTPKRERSLEGTRKAAQALRTRAPSYPDPIIKGAWCQPSLYGEAQKSLITRNEACPFYDVGYQVTYVYQGLPVATYRASFEFAFQVTTDPKTSEIKTWIQINPTYSNFPPDDRAVLLGDGGEDAFIDSMCFSDGCEGGAGAKNFDFYNDLSWQGGGEYDPTDSHMATGTADHKWNGSVNNAGGTRDVDLSKELPVWFVGHFVTESGPPDGKGDKGLGTGPWRSPGIDVRATRSRRTVRMPVAYCRSTCPSTSPTPPSTRRAPVPMRCPGPP